MSKAITLTEEQHKYVRHVFTKRSARLEREKKTDEQKLAAGILALFGGPEETAKKAPKEPKAGKKPAEGEAFNKNNANLRAVEPPPAGETQEQREARARATEEKFNAAGMGKAEPATKPAPTKPDDKKPAPAAAKPATSSAAKPTQDGKRAPLKSVTKPVIK